MYKLYTSSRWTIAGCDVSNQAIQAISRLCGLCGDQNSRNMFALSLCQNAIFAWFIRVFKNIWEWASISSKAAPTRQKFPFTSKKPHYGSDDFAWGSEPTCGRNNLPAGAPRCQRQASLDSRRPRCANSCGVGARTVSDGCVEASRAHKARRDRAPCAVFLWVQDDSREKKLSFTKRDPWFTREETMFQEKGSFDYSGLNSTQIQSKA